MMQMVAEQVRYLLDEQDFVHGFKPIFSQVTPYGAPPEVFVFGLCQLYAETKRPRFPDLLILFMDFSFTNTKYD